MFKKRFYMFLLFIVGVYFLVSVSNPRFTIFNIAEEQDDLLENLPVIKSGEEFVLGEYKISNTSNVLTLTLREISCQWKPDNIDDGWKKCEATFLIDSMNDYRQVISSPTINLSFIDKNVRNIDFSLSSDFVYYKDNKDNSNDSLTPSLGFSDFNALPSQITETVSEIIFEENNLSDTENYSLNGSLDSGIDIIAQANITSNSSSFITSFFTNEPTQEISTKDPFAIKVSFEIPKYESNNFDFEITDEHFSATIDPYVSACGILDSNGGIYTLSSDIETEGSCFNLNADDITFDCNGHSINYANSYTGEGIYINNSENILIKNCNLNQNNASVLYSNAVKAENSNFHIINSTIFTNGSASFGIYSDASLNSIVLENNNITTSKSDAYGIYILDGMQHNISYNSIITYGTNAFGIAANLPDSNNTFFSYNNITTFGTAHGIKVEIGNGLEVDHNNINTTSDSSYGIVFESGELNNLSNNHIVIAGSNGYGIYFEGTHNNDIGSNLIETYGTSSNAVFLMQDSRNNDIFRNNITTYGDNAYGIIMLEDSSMNNITDQDIFTYGVDSYGIYFGDDSKNNTIRGSSIITYGSEAYGLEIETSDNYLEYSNITTFGNSSSGVYFWNGANNNLLKEIKSYTNGNNSNSLELSSPLMNITLIRSLLNSSSANSYSFKTKGDYNQIYFYDSILNCRVPCYSYYISEANGADLGSIIFVNSSLNDSFHDDNSLIEVNTSWYVHSNTSFSNTSLISGAQIDLYNADGVLVSSEETDSLGIAHHRAITASRSNATSESIFSPFLAIAIAEGLEPINQTFYLDGNKELYFIFNSSSSTPNFHGSSSGGGILGPGTKTGQNGNNSIRGRKALFDIALELSEHELYSDNDLIGTLTLINFGIPGEIQVNLHYYIIDESSQKIVYESNKKVNVETQTEFLETFKTSSLEPGNYQVVIELTYPGQIEPAATSSKFSILQKDDKSLFDINLIYILILILSFIIAAYIYQNYKKR